MAIEEPDRAEGDQLRGVLDPQARIPRRRPHAGRAHSRYARRVTDAISHVEPPSLLSHMVARIVDVLHPVQVWLFGSRARGQARPDSDWDMMAILPDDAPEQDLDLMSVWGRLRDLRLQRLELFTMTQSEFDAWKDALGTLAEIVASTGIVVYGG
jgi:predicted nucleotidyltransferase